MALNIELEIICWCKKIQMIHIGGDKYKCPSCNNVVKVNQKKELVTVPRNDNIFIEFPVYPHHFTEPSTGTPMPPNPQVWCG